MTPDVVVRSSLTQQAVSVLQLTALYSKPFTKQKQLKKWLCVDELAPESGKQKRCTHFFLFNFARSWWDERWGRKVSSFQSVRCKTASIRCFAQLAGFTTVQRRDRMTKEILSCLAVVSEFPDEGHISVAYRHTGGQRRLVRLFRTQIRYDIHLIQRYMMKVKGLYMLVGSITYTAYPR